MVISLCTKKKKTTKNHWDSIHKKYIGILESWTLHDFKRLRICVDFFFFERRTCVDKSQVYDGYI